jgi:hypothetical protein
MGIFKTYFQQLKAPNEKAKAIEILSPVTPVPEVVSVKTKAPVTAKLKTTVSDDAFAKVNAIEAMALSVGWCKDQFWQEAKRYDLSGLVMFIKPHHAIREVRKEFITLSWQAPQGYIQSTRFYNMRVPKP